MTARLEELVERLQPLRPVRILLFGSSARGSADELSDLDVIVVAEHVAGRFLDRIAEAFDLVDPRYALDILIYTPDEYRSMLDDRNPLVEAAEREGRLLYERPAA
jgi:predicted nucleotidyltransferase